MIHIDRTETERQSGHMPPTHLQQAVTARKDDRSVSLSIAFDPAHLDYLYQGSVPPPKKNAPR
jgi:hypothetical protein